MTLDIDLVGALWIVVVAGLGFTFFRWLGGLLAVQSGMGEAVGKALLNVFH